MSRNTSEKRVAHWYKQYEKGNLSETQALQAGIAILDGVRFSKQNKLVVTGQPFDHHLIELSPLFKRSRQLSLKSGCNFEAALISSPRSLSSPTLLSSKIEFSPIERELIWSATDRLEKQNLARLVQVRNFSSNLFHEQSHRLLWKLLPPPTATQDAVRRYLNFSESLVIATDMALGDELGLEWARLFFTVGTVYDPGTTVRQLGLSRRQYRNYLHAVSYATYLGLELYSLDGIAKAIRQLYPLRSPDNTPESLVERALRRACGLEEMFVALTNPAWQKKHWRKVVSVLTKTNKNKPLHLPKDPLDNHLAYLWAECWFDFIRL